MALGLLAGSCASGGGDGSGTAGPEGRLAAQVASSDLYAGAPQRFLLGVSGQDDEGFKVLTGGELRIRFDYLGPEGTEPPEPGPEVAATYVPAPGTPDAGRTTPGLTPPSEGRGAYEAEDVVFDRAGVWEAVTEVGGKELTAAFGVTERPQLPAPGERAPRTENLTMDSAGVDPAAIDSRALQGAEVPDPELHATTVADAIDAGRPVLLIVATPTYCTSELCGPDVEVVEDLAGRFSDRAAFVHIEVWGDFQAQQVNDAASEWIEPVGTEPWMWLIGADGRIVDRWGPIWDVDEVTALLADLPAA